MFYCAITITNVHYKVNRKGLKLKDNHHLKLFVIVYGTNHFARSALRVRFMSVLEPTTQHPKPMKWTTEGDHVLLVLFAFLFGTFVVSSKALSCVISDRYHWFREC